MNGERQRSLLMAQIAYRSNVFNNELFCTSAKDSNWQFRYRRETLVKRTAQMEQHWFATLIKWSEFSAHKKIQIERKLQYFPTDLQPVNTCAFIQCTIRSSHALNQQSTVNRQFWHEGNALERNLIFLLFIVISSLLSSLHPKQTNIT